MIACNTASTLVLPQLRARFAVPFVGTVPAIKPACAASASRLVSVLGTEATVQREYTRALIRDFAGGCTVTLVGSPRLAELAEAELKGETAPDQAIAAEIAPCFVETQTEGRQRTDTIVLACTHYPLLLDRLVQLAPWPVSFIDPAPAIARRVVNLLGPVGNRRRCRRGSVFTSGRRPGAESRAGRFRAGRRRRSRRLKGLGCLTPPLNRLKNRPSRGPFGPRGVSRPAVFWPRALAAKPVGSGKPGTEEGAILKT